MLLATEEEAGMNPLAARFGERADILLPINGRDGRRYRANTIGNLTYQEAVDLAGEVRPGLVCPAHHGMFVYNTADPGLFVDYLTAKYPSQKYWVGDAHEQVGYEK